MVTTSPEPRPLVGIGWMIVTGLCFVALTGLVKHLGDELPAVQTGFLRYLLGLLFVLPMLGALRHSHLTSANLRFFGLRGAVHSLGVILWFYAMTRITVAEVTAMNYLTPVYITLGAALFLGERLALRRFLAVAAAFLGVLIILRPGLREVSPGHLAMIGTAIFFAASYLMAKRMSGTSDASVVVAMLSITVTICLAPFAIMVWAPPSPLQLFWLFWIAAFGTAGHYAMTLAFKAAPVTVTQPVTFLQLIWAVALGAILFGEAVDAYVILGGCVIMASVAFITWREAVLRRQITRPAPLL
ncbi:MAG: DMT family transporter [Roseinatronobacter sp.]